MVEKEGSEFLGDLFLADETCVPEPRISARNRENHAQKSRRSCLPHNTTIIVRWTNTDSLPDGSRYENHGAHIVKMRWGKIVEIDANEDSQAVAEALRIRAAHWDRGGVGTSHRELIRECEATVCKLHFRVRIRLAFDLFLVSSSHRQQVRLAGWKHSGRTKTMRLTVQEGQNTNLYMFFSYS